MRCKAFFLGLLICFFTTLIYAQAPPPDTIDVNQPGAFIGDIIVQLPHWFKFLNLNQTIKRRTLSGKNNSILAMAFSTRAKYFQIITTLNNPENHNCLSHPNPQKDWRIITIKKAPQ